MVYTAWVPAPTVSADELLTRARTWLATAGPAYRVTYPYYHPATNSVSAHVVIKQGLEHYTVRLHVQAQEGAYQYRLDHITHTRPSYAREGKHSTGPVTTRVESVVYTRPSRYRTRKLAEVDRQVQRLLQALERTMQPRPALLVNR